MKIINTRKEELLSEKREIYKFNKKLKDINESIVDKNNMTWVSSVLLSVAVIFIGLALIPINTNGFWIYDLIRYFTITILSIIIGVLIGTKLSIPFYRPLLGIKRETESMHVAYLLYKYNPMAIARKGESYLLVLEDKNTKVIMKEVIMFKHIEKTNINEIILDVDKERLYIPYKK